MIQQYQEQISRESLNPEIAEILGAFIGDGWIESDENALYITGSPTEDKSYYEDHLAPLFAKYFGYVTARHFFYWKVFGIATYKREVIRKAISLGFQKGKKCYDASIPDRILESKDEEVLKGIVRGIFDTDGSFWCEKSNAKTSTEWKKTHNYRPELCIASCSKTLLLQVQELALKLGIETQVKNKHKKGLKSGRNCNESYQLRVRRLQEIENWFRIIGSNNPRHKTRFEVWKKLGYLPPYTRIEERLEILKLNEK